MFQDPRKKQTSGAGPLSNGLYILEPMSKEPKALHTSDDFDKVFLLHRLLGFDQVDSNSIEPDSGSISLLVTTFGI